MKSQEIQERIYMWALYKDFNAPYGVLTGQHTSQNGKPFRTVTFGRARTLDATVEIYNPSFIVLRTSRYGREVFKSMNEMMPTLESL